MLRLLALFLLVFSVSLASVPARAELLLKRGLAIEPWTTWPGDERLAEPQLIAQFPEWRGSVSDAELRTLKATGMDFVRLPLDPAIYLFPANHDKWDELTAGAMNTVRRILAADLKVIVDLHAMPAVPGWKSQGSETYVATAASFQEYLKLVDHVGRALAGEDPGRVLFEPLNEPVLDCDPKSRNPRWPGMAVQMHSVARAAAPSITIVLSGACWGGARGLVRMDPATIRDSNVMWSFHSYEPFIFTHQGATWINGTEIFVSGLDYPPDRKQWRRVLTEAEARIAKAKLNKAEKAKLKKELRYNLQRYFRSGQQMMGDDFSLVRRWAKKHGIPPARILLGEFGAHRVGTSEGSRARYLLDTRLKAEKAGYAWSAWSWRGSFGLGVKEDSTMLAPAVRSSLGLQ